MISKVLLVASVLVFLLAVFGVSFCQNMLALGLALYAGSKLVP